MQLHPHFGFDDGDLILQCDDVQFRVHYSQIFPRSKIMQFYYRAFMGVIHPDGLLFAGNLKGGSEAWACLASTAPSFDELCGILRVASLYQFDNVREWALARLRIKFFPHPAEFYKRRSNGRVETTVDDALRLFVSRCIPPTPSNIELSVPAAYIIARKNPYSVEIQEIKECLEPLKWEMLMDARAFMQREFLSASNAMLALPFSVDGATDLGHDSPVCSRLLSTWIEDMQLMESDVLRVLYRLQTETPMGPVCQHCIAEAQFLAKQGSSTLSAYLPVCFGFNHTVTNGWEIPETVKHRGSREFLLLPLTRH
ncbi:hypothetical protein M422DRAFT_268947 [Sphaerobolus stellatus SS14]|uniref:Uncharacterized protein n=1 Tax=Sphaerobolus stellatus (strain SS14) TaxID=990650 RepID=A0A0C9UW91_SPHS4|nr:hypothetical protein M422DRAFT_268947 [Sphaerobolus stellatus SS14]